MLQMFAFNGILEIRSCTLAVGHVLHIRVVSIITPLPFTLLRGTFGRNFV